VWDPKRAPGEQGAEEQYTLSDALAVAAWLNVFVRQSRYMGMANIAQSVNVISPLMTTERGLVKQTTWWPLLLFSKYMRGTTLSIHVGCGEYEGAMALDWIRGTVETPLLDCSACLGDDGWVTFAVVNIDSRDLETKIDGVKSGAVKVFTVTGDNVKVTNTETETSVRIAETEWDGNGLYNFPKHSLTMLRWHAL
jgi:alpha-N-arabinofuranosidase